MGYFSRHLIFILLLMGCGSSAESKIDVVYVVDMTNLKEVRLYTDEDRLRAESPCIVDHTGCYYQGVIWCMINDEYVCGEELFHALKEIDPSIEFDNPHY